MNIGLIGYGKMGKAIEKILLERGHSIAFISNSEAPIDLETLAKADVAIEFTIPQLAVKHIELALIAKTPIVVGTTAWQDSIQQVSELVNKHDGSLLYASNFSIGVNIFFEINKKLAQLMSKQSDYMVHIEEAHHLQKLDSPSGTAISIANDILDNNDSYYSWKCGEATPPQVNAGQIPLTSFREDGVTGTHIVRYESEVDQIKITHEAYNRTGFALGAVIASEWLFNKKGVFTMQDVLK